MSRYVLGVVALLVCVVTLTVSCRRNQPSLVDRNQPPDTQLWYAPPDSTEYEYIVHMYWRGTDGDGVTERFIWSIQDTLAVGVAYWNPAERLRDFRMGRITERTDSVFSFTAYKDVAGVGVRKNRQAFFVASIDDNGVIDPVPAGVEFVATIGQLPEMHFVNYIIDDQGGRHPRPYSLRTPPADTIGMFKPFAMSYHGTTTNGDLNAYLFFPLSSTILLPGAGEWIDITDDADGNGKPDGVLPSDTLQNFPNTQGPDAFPAGTFRFAAKCIDDAGAESQIDAGQFRRGVSQVVVNFDPDTRITEVKNTYFKNRQPIIETIDFADARADTVPFGSWLYYRYFAFDDRRDTWACSPTDADKCIDFQIRFVRNSARVAGAYEDSNWLPRSGRHDSDANSATDSNTVNIGSLEYDFFAGGIDENGSRDGTPPTFHIVGNFDPTMDTYGVRDHFNNALNVSTVDTLTWNFYKGVGWPYNAKSDTFEAASGKYYKRFGWTVNAAGHDHVKDPDGSAIKSWRYFVYTNYDAGSGTGDFWALGRAGESWFPGTANNVMSDHFELLIKYDNPTGDDLFADLPGYFNQTITMVLYGRDTRVGQGDFSQYAFWNEVQPDMPASSVTKKNLINAFNTESIGRWTPKRIVTFYLKFER